MEHDERAFAKADDFLSFARKDDDGDAALGDLLDDFVDFLFGSDIDALRRVVENQNLRFCIDPAGEDDLLLVSAGKRCDQVVFVCVFDAEVRGMGCEIIMLRGILEEEEFAIAFQCGERAVGFDAEVGDDGVFFTVAGHVGNAFFQRGGRAFRVVFFTVE